MKEKNYNEKPQRDEISSQVRVKVAAISQQLSERTCAVFAIQKLSCRAADWFCRATSRRYHWIYCAGLKFILKPDPFMTNTTPELC